MGDYVKTKRFLMQNFLLHHRFAVTFFAGICIGTGYANIAYRYQAALPEIYNQHYLSAYADITMNYYALWKYIIRYRFRDLLLIGMMGLTVFRKYLIAFYIAYLGICAGMLVSTSVMYYGLAGIGLYLASVVPQYILYGTALYFLYQMFYVHHLTGKNVLIITVIAVILVGAGTYTEAYCNPLILKKLYGYLY